MAERNRGFTLMETLAVIFIMVVIAGIMLPALRRVREGGRVTHARNEISQLITAIRMYAEDWGDYPPDDGTSGGWGSGHSQGLYTSRSLIEILEEGGYASWPRIVIDDDGNLLDPWGNPYRYEYEPAGAPPAPGVEFSLYSAGPDREYWTENDITNW